MKLMALFILLLAGPISVFGSEEPCASEARNLFQTVTGQAPNQFGLSSTKFNTWADAQEYVYLAANGMSSAYIMEYLHLDGRRCFLLAMRFDGDL